MMSRASTGGREFFFPKGKGYVKIKSLTKLRLFILYVSFTFWKEELSPARIVTMKIDQKRVNMANAAMIHFGLDPGKLVLWLGGEYWPECFSRPKQRQGSCLT